MPTDFFRADVSEKLDEWNCRPCADRHYRLVDADANHSEDTDGDGRRLCGCSEYHDSLCMLTYGDI
jgi:hypothetical protein